MKSEVKLNEEFSTYRWVTYDEAMEVLPKNSQKFLQQAYNYLQQYEK
jgi:hypothetical protein